MQTTDHARKALSIINALNESGVKCILYGSSGLSLYLGAYKQFNDIDLLIDEHWLKEDWAKLQSIMKSLDYDMVDKHEHEFSNKQREYVAFAPSSILKSDGILEAQENVTFVEVDGVNIGLLTPQQFLKAYEFSIKDGYRQNVRGKKDAEAITLLKSYIATLPNT